MVPRATSVGWDEEVMGAVVRPASRQKSLLLRGESHERAGARGAVKGSRDPALPLCQVCVLLSQWHRPGELTVDEGRPYPAASSVYEGQCSGNI